MNDVHRTFSSHDGEFSGGPGHIVITLQVLTGHGEVGAAVGFAGDEGQLRHGGLSVSKEEFCAMANDTTPFLDDTRKESRHVFEREQWNVEGVASANEPRRFDGGVNIKTARQHFGLIANHAHG